MDPIESSHFEIYPRIEKDWAFLVSLVVSFVSGIKTFPKESMNVNVSPPRKGFCVIPNEKIRRIPFHNVDFVLDSCFSTQMRGPTKEFDVRNFPFREFHLSSEDERKEKQRAKNRTTKSKSKECSSLNGLGGFNLSFPPPRSGMRVRFLLDENGDVLTEKIALKVHDGLKDEDNISSWLSKTELLEIKKRAKQFCRPFLSKRPDYRSAVVRMLVRCGAQRTGEISEQEYSLDHTESEEDEDLSTIVDGMHRGLEKRMISALNLPFHTHKRSICVVVDIQSRLRAIGPSSFTADQKARLIATQYAVNAQYAKEWARKIAQGDSLSVARNFQYDW
jgi:hypothetical protein